MDGLGEAEFVDAGLETTLQEIFGLKCQHVIELHAGLIEHTNSYKSTNQCVTFEEALWIFLVECEQLTTDVN